MAHDNPNARQLEFSFNYVVQYVREEESGPEKKRQRICFNAIKSIFGITSRKVQILQTALTKNRLVLNLDFNIFDHDNVYF